MKIFKAMLLMDLANVKKLSLLIAKKDLIQKKICDYKNYLMFLSLTAVNLS
jgi:hypothetical protein